MTADGNPAPQNNTRLQIFGSGSPNILPPVNSNPVNSGQGNAFWSPLESRVVLYTEEYTMPAADLYQITYETNHNNSDDPQEDFPILKIDGNWYAPDCAYVHTDPDNNSGTYTTASFIVRDVTWMQLDIDTATNKAATPGTGCVGTGDFDPPLQTGLSYDSLGATVEAFGLYLPDPESVNVIDQPSGSNQAPRERFDNYTLLAQYVFADIYVSAENAGVTDDNLAYGPHDVLLHNGISWSKWFDGSAAGLMPNGNAKHNINALWIPDTAGDDVVMSFTQNARFVDGVSGKVDGMDLVRWDGDSFTLWFDGQDVGLNNLTKEKIDALHVLDGALSPIGNACQAYLLVSTAGDGQVPNHSGGTIKFDGTDVLGFCLTNSGANTAGFWHRVLNGKAEGMPGQALINLSASDDGQTLYFTTRATFNVDSAQGGHSMVYRYDVATTEFSGPYFSAPANGLDGRIDGLQVDGQLP
jgi:hypothetical protein